jgi:FUN14 domain-containing protein 1
MFNFYRKEHKISTFSRVQLLSNKILKKFIADNFLHFGIKNSSFRFVNLIFRKMSRSSSNSVIDFIRNTFDDIQDMSTVNQIVVGGVSGLATGYVFSRVGKLAAFTIGSTLITLQVAQHLGYIEVRWGKKKSQLSELKKKAIKAAEQAGLTGNNPNDKAEQVMGEVKSFFQNNFTFALSFGGGALIGFSF